MWPPQFLERERRGGAAIVNGASQLSQTNSSLCGGLQLRWLLCHCSSSPAGPRDAGHPPCGAHLSSLGRGAQGKLLPRLQEFTPQHGPTLYKVSEMQLVHFLWPLAPAWRALPRCLALLAHAASLPTKLSSLFLIFQERWTQFHRA